MVYAFHNPDQTSLRLHLDLAEQAAYLRFKSVLIYGIIKEGGKEAMNCFPLLFERGADVHLNVNDETPTTTAMRFSTWFSRQLVLLIRAGKGLKLFIVCKLALSDYPLDKTGWRVDTLGDLFALCRKTTMHLKAFQIPEHDYYSCECCRSRRLRFAHVEPWWETLLRLVRTKQCLCRSLDTTWLVEGILVASNHGSSREIRCLDKWIFGLKHIRRRFRSRVDRDDFSTPRSDLGEDMTRPHICHWRLESGDSDSVSTISMDKTLSSQRDCGSHGMTCHHESEMQADPTRQAMDMGERWPRICVILPAPLERAMAKMVRARGTVLLGLSCGD